MHRTLHLASVVIGFLAIVFTSSITRATVSSLWDESTNGEFPELYDYETDHIVSWQDFGALGPGSYSVTGTSTQTSTFFGNTFDGDAFEITIPPGEVLTSLTMTRDLTAGVREFFQITGSTGGPYHVVRRFPALNLPAGTSDLLSLDDDANSGHPIGPLGPGSYVLSYDNETFNTTMNYTITLTVVPEPTSIVAIAMGAMLSLGMRRRRRPLQRTAGSTAKINS